MGGNIYILPSEYIEEGRRKGRAEGEKEGGNKMIYRLVTKGVITLEVGATELGISVGQLRSDMLDAGYGFPEES